MTEKTNINYFIEKSSAIHNNKYDYSLVNYVNNKTKVKIICKDHGIFEQIPNNHLSGSICRKCSYEKNAKNSKKSLNDFIINSNDIHHNKYDYSLVDYINNKTKVKIICKNHGIFEQRPDCHLHQGCPKCTGNVKLTNIEFISLSNKKHQNKYDYSLTDYRNNRTKVKIICKKHGIFEQRPKDHMKGVGCWKCKENFPKTLEDFIIKSKHIHKEKYDYSKSIYKSSLSKLIIICKNHGEFYQTPNKHITLKQGCPRCKKSKGVNEICDILQKFNIQFETEKTLKGCISKNSLYFDIFIPKNNVFIEYDGEQHFIPIKKWGGEENLKGIKERDQIKNKFCFDRNIKLFRISYKDVIEEKVKEIISSHLHQE